MRFHVAASTVTLLALYACAPAPPPQAPTPARPVASVSEVRPAPPIPPARGGSLSVRYLDIGQGDAALLETGDGKVMLVDAGPPEAASKVEGILRALGRTVDVVLLSHAHADHMGNLDDCAAKLPIGRFLDPGYSEHPSRTYPRTLAALAKRGIPVKIARKGLAFDLGATTRVTVLGPHEPLLSRTRSDVNANSVVARVDHHAAKADARFLFVGDAEEPTEKRLLEGDRAELRANVLKIAHHGSRHASTDAFLAAAHPEYGVISCATGNDYGHPHAQALKRLATREIKILRTDLMGDVTVTSAEAGLSVATEKHPAEGAVMIPGATRAHPSAPESEAP